MRYLPSWRRRFRSGRLLSETLNGCFTGMSRCHKGIRELREAARETKSAREEAFCRNCFHTEYKETFSEETQVQPESTVTSREIERMVLLTGGNHTTELYDYLVRIFDEAAQGILSPKNLEESIRQYCLGVRKMYEGILDDREQERLNELQNIWSYECLRVYRGIFMEDILSMQARMQERISKTRSRQNIQNAIDYINRHYMEDLNMAVVSNYVSMNYSVFSVAFKERTGKNFVTYLRDTRIEEAARLLVSTELQIREVGRKVGYENERQFSRSFHQVKGMTLGEFRRSHTIL